MKTSVYVFGIITSVALIACAAPTETSAPIVNVDNFTTDGKPTKTVRTPWGDKEVYDPTQDPDVITAFDYVKKNHLQENYELGPNAKTYEALFAKVRKIQYNDMIRLGCAIPDKDGCGGGAKYSVNTIKQDCEVLAFGTAEFNRCEEANLQSDGWHETLAKAAPECSAEFSMIGSKDWRHKAYGDEEIDIFFKSGCLSYEGNP